MRGLTIIQTLVLVAMAVGILAVSVALARTVNQKACEQGTAIESLGGGGGGGCGELGSVARFVPAAEATASPTRSGPRVVPPAEAPVTETRIAADVVGAAGREVRDALNAELARGADAVELSRTAFESATRAVAHLAPGASASARADAAFAVTMFALIGSGHIDDLAMVDSGATDVVGYMRDAKAQAQASGFAHPALPDATRGGGTLNPRYSDGTRSQAFHTGFFVAAGYVSAGSVIQTAKVRVAAIYHESFEPQVFANGGTSRADYVASVVGSDVGQYLKGMRDRGNGDVMSSVVGAFMARPELAEPLPPGRDPARNAIAAEEIARIRAHVESWSLYLAVDLHPIANGMIGTSDLLQWMWGTKDPSIP